jgi:hypothetical protein
MKSACFALEILICPTFSLRFLVFTQIHSWMNCIMLWSALCVCVSMCVCNVCGSRQEFLTEDLPVGPIIFSIHLVIRHTKSDKKFTIFISISGSKYEGGIEKSSKWILAMIDNSAVWKARAVKFSLLDRARRAAYSAIIGFSRSGYSSVLHWLKVPLKASIRWTTRVKSSPVECWHLVYGCEFYAV